MGVWIEPRGTPTDLELTCAAHRDASPGCCCCTSTRCHADACFLPRNGIVPLSFIQGVLFLRNGVKNPTCIFNICPYFLLKLTHVLKEGLCYLHICLYISIINTIVGDYS